MLRKIGGNFSFSRPLNGGDPYKDSKWNVLAGMSFAEVRPINFAGDTRPYGVSNNKFRKGKVNKDDVPTGAAGRAKAVDDVGAD